MTRWELFDIAEQGMELVNPTTPGKIIKAGQVAGLTQGSRVIDFGCGYGEPLALWAQEFGIEGVGIDIRESACHRARGKMADRGLSEAVKIVCANAAEYNFTAHSFDVATCIGALFIWKNDLQHALQHMGNAIRDGGKLIVGEAYWLTQQVPPEYSRKAQAIRTEYELLKIFREAGFVIEWVTHASHDEWDRYESDNWQGLIDWLRTNPTHPDRQQVQEHLYNIQAEYFRYGRHYFGWALYVLASIP